MNQNHESIENSPASVGQYLAALKQHGHSVFLSSLLLAVCGIVGVSLLPNVYRATTTILVDPQKIPERYVASTVTSDPNERLSTLTQQVLSDSRMQEIIDRNNLYPQLHGTKSREEILDYMRAKTTIELKQASEQGLSSFSISYEDSDRLLVATIANQLAFGFIDWDLNARKQQALSTTQFLSTELELSKKSLEHQERELEAFRIGHAGATPDQLNVNLQALSRLQADVQSNTDAIGRLDQERILLTQVTPTDVYDNSSLNERGGLLQQKHRLESELWSLKRQFTDTYPDVVIATQQLKEINAQLAEIPESSADASDSYDSNTKVRLALIDKQMQRHKQQLTVLQHQIGIYQGKVESVPALETQMAELTRNYEQSRQNYQSLLDKTFSAAMSEDLERKQQAERFTVLDPAKTPEKPVKPRRLPLMAGMVVLALLIPSGTVIALHALSGSVKSEVDLKSMLPLRIPILGTIPPIVNKTDLRRGRLIAVQTFVLSVIACLALVVFLLKIRPIL
jgi:succinoglycan biosynthesis transport protein ExoP